MYNSSLKSKKEKGQGLVEYALILVLVSIVVIAALLMLGPSISNIFTSVNTTLTTYGGGSNNTQCANAKQMLSTVNEQLSFCQQHSGFCDAQQNTVNFWQQQVSASCG